MLNDRRDPAKWRIAPDLGPVTASAGHLLVFEALRRPGLFAALPGASDRSQGWTGSRTSPALRKTRVYGSSPSGWNRTRRSVEAPHCRAVPAGRKRIFPSGRSIHGWLERFCPSRAKGFGMFDEVFHRLVHLGFAWSGSAFATIDLDATIICSFKKECEPTYRAANGDVRGERGYQPLVAFCAEIGMVLHAEMRAGNVPASKGNLEALEASLGHLPQSVERAVLRTNYAGYQERIIRFVTTRPFAPSRSAGSGLSP